jgi:hypothetical protein
VRVSRCVKEELARENSGELLYCAQRPRPTEGRPETELSLGTTVSNDGVETPMVGRDGYEADCPVLTAHRGETSSYNS